jgi:chromate reductase
VRLDVWEGLERLPSYSEALDREAGPPAAADLRRAIAGANALLVATPEYNASLPGGLKNAFDWASRPFPDNSLRGKPVAVIGASTGLFGAIWAQAEARKVLSHIGARVIDEELPVGQADEAFDPNGALTDPELRGNLSELLGRLIAKAKVSDQCAA